MNSLCIYFEGHFWTKKSMKSPVFCLHFKKKRPPWSQFGTLMFIHDKSLSAMWSSHSLVSQFSVCWRLSDKLKGSPCAREFAKHGVQSTSKSLGCASQDFWITPVQPPLSLSLCLPLTWRVSSPDPPHRQRLQAEAETAEAPPFRHIWNSVKAERSAPTLSLRIATQ